LTLTLTFELESYFSISARPLHPYEKYIYSLFRTKCSQDRIKTVYKTQKIDTQTKERKKNLWKHNNCGSESI